VVQLHREIAAIHDRGADVVVIGNGNPMFIEGFRETTGFAGAIYTDPSLELYSAVQLRRGLSTVFSLRGVGRAVGALRRGHRQGRTQGDALQQGGVLVVATDGRVIWQQISSGPGDNASVAEIVAALDADAMRPRTS
jgi:hypothetical protein